MSLKSEWKKHNNFKTTKLRLLCNDKIRVKTYENFKKLIKCNQSEYLFLYKSN
jgi:hypothetical protein